MPTVFRKNGYRFFFYSNEGDPSHREPPHIHAQRADNVAKFWLTADVPLEKNYGMNSNDLGAVRRIIQGNLAFFRRKWNDHFDPGATGPTCLV
jgi:hypothetical protein